MDIADRAQKVIEQTISVALSQRRTKNKPSAIYCEDCGRLVPEERRKAVPGCTRCVDCQREFEEG